MQLSTEGEKPKITAPRRSSLKTRQLVNKLDPNKIGKRNSVSFGLSNTFEFKAMKAMFQESKDLNKKETPEEKEKHNKFLANRKASIKNEFSVLKDIMKKNYQSIIEEDNDEETKNNMKKNIEMGKEGLKEDSESSSSKSKSSSKSSSRSGSKSRSSSGSKSNSKSVSKSSSPSKSKSRSSSKHINDKKKKNLKFKESEKEKKEEKKTEKKSIKKKGKVQMVEKSKEESDKENEKNREKEPEKISIKKKKKVQMAEKSQEERDKKNETEKIDIKKKRKVQIADSESEKENEKENEKEKEKDIIKKKRKVQIEDKENEIGSDKESEKIIIKKYNKNKTSDKEDEEKDKKELAINIIKEAGTKIRLITLKEANNLNLDQIAYITLTDGTIVIPKKDDEKTDQEDLQKENDISKNKKLNLKKTQNVEMTINQNNIIDDENNFEDDIYGSPYIPCSNYIYSNTIRNMNNSRFNVPIGIRTTRYINNLESKYLNYIPNYYPYRPIPTLYINQEPPIPINAPYDLNLSQSPFIGSNMSLYMSSPQYPPYMNQNIIPSNIPYELNFSQISGMGNNTMNNPNLLNQHQYQTRNITKQAFSKPQNFRTNYQDYYQFSKLLNVSNNKNQNLNNKTNIGQKPISNIAQSMSPNQNTKFKYKFLESTPVKICDCNTGIHRHNKSTQYGLPFSSSQGIEQVLVSPKINQSQYQNKRKPLNYSQNNIINNNNYDNRVNSSEPELNIFNNQVTDSLNDFDNLEEEQVEFRNEEPYKNYGFKFNEIPIIKSGGKINSQKIFKQNIINNIKPLTKPQTNKRNLTNEFRYRIQPNNFNDNRIKQSIGINSKRK